MQPRDLAVDVANVEEQCHECQSRDDQNTAEMFPIYRPCEQTGEEELQHDCGHNHTDDHSAELLAVQRQYVLTDGLDLFAAGNAQVDDIVGREEDSKNHQGVLDPREVTAQTLFHCGLGTGRSEHWRTDRDRAHIDSEPRVLISL